MRYLSIISFLLLAIFAMGLGLWTYSTNNSQPITSTASAVATPILAGGFALAEPRSLPQFSLIDKFGLPFTNSNLQGKWTLVFFGYSFCPDICPTTLSMLNQLVSRDKLIDKTDVLFVSVDPARDTSERLQQYVANFNPDILAATGSEAALLLLTQGLGIPYFPLAPNLEDDFYLVDHSSAIILLNPEAKLAAVFTSPHIPITLTEDIIKIQQFNKYS